MESIELDFFRRNPLSKAKKSLATTTMKDMDRWRRNAIAIQKIAEDGLAEIPRKKFKSRPILLLLSIQKNQKIDSSVFMKIVFRHRFLN